MSGDTAANNYALTRNYPGSSSISVMGPNRVINQSFVFWWDHNDHTLSVQEFPSQNSYAIRRKITMLEARGNLWSDYFDMGDYGVYSFCIPHIATSIFIKHANDFNTIRGDSGTVNDILYYVDMDISGTRIRFKSKTNENVYVEVYTIV